jgi:hypothetical protein
MIATIVGRDSPSTVFFTRWMTPTYLFFIVLLLHFVPIKGHPVSSPGVTPRQFAKEEANGTHKSSFENDTHLVPFAKSLMADKDILQLVSNTFPFVFIR